MRRTPAPAGQPVVGLAAGGQALVEAAVALPLLCLAALVLVQFALLAHAAVVVTGAAQDGARVAAAIDRSLLEGRRHAAAVLRAGLGDSAEVAIGGSETAETVEIVAEARLRLIVPIGRTGTIPLRARATMIRERFRAGE